MPNIFDSIKNLFSGSSSNSNKNSSSNSNSNKNSSSNTTNNRNGITATATTPASTVYTSQNVQNYLKNLSNNKSSSGTSSGSTGFSTNKSGSSSNLATGSTSLYGTNSYLNNSTLENTLKAQQNLSTAAADATSNGYNGNNTKLVNASAGTNTLGNTYNSTPNTAVYATPSSTGTYINTVLTADNGETQGYGVDVLPTYDEVKAYTDAINNVDNNNNNNNGDSNGNTGDTTTETGLTTADTSYYSELIEQLMSQNEEARQTALDAIMQNLDSVKGTYKQQIQEVIDEYDALVNENEVKKDQARRFLRENQANRGQLDSGMGRQELLDMNLGYDNETMELKLAREKAVNEIYNLIAQAEAEANTNKANVNNTYNNAALEYQLQLANASNS